MQTRNYGLGSYLGFSPSVSLIYFSSKITSFWRVDLAEYLELNCLLFAETTYGWDWSIPFNEIFEFVENLLFVLF